jgi:hypothetical protein
MVDIYVGAERRKWTIHKKLICTRVPYFEKAFQGSFQEATDQSICLTEEDPAGFEVFLSWLYTGSLAGVMPENVKVNEERLRNNPDCDPENATTIKLVEFFIQADKFLLPDEVKTAILDNLVIIRKSKFLRICTSISLGIVSRVLKATSTDSPLQTFILDSVCFDFVDKHEFMKRARDEMHRDNLDLDIIVFLEALRSHFSNGFSDCDWNYTVFNQEEIEGSVADIPRYKTGYLKKPKWESLHGASDR